ncbi:YacL family protein [Pseudanabaena sp. Chao 1811]|uniref:YacL family protein n=1 Tax=Pseudanabaena sp. Chao 1811 TaxID=2963092 RepID=UPI0022F38DD0|nr:YacL family protein [Pseudanabaena sp. Chao 1811]
MINIQFYRDAEGYFKADTDAQYLLLGQYFETEVQGVIGVCADLLETIQEIEIGDRNGLEGVGNAYGLKINSTRVTIWNEFAENEQTLDIPLSDFKQVLENCYIFLQTMS